MLKRLFIDNFRCFVNFEFRPERKQLIVGRNGTGKSSFMDALLFLRRFAQGSAGDEAFTARQPTAWLLQDRQVFELEAALKSGTFVYRLELETVRGPTPFKVSSETVLADGLPVFEFKNGEVDLFSGPNGSFTSKFPANTYRSALANTPFGTDRLSQFKIWLDRLLCFRLNPFSMDPLAQAPASTPNTDLSNIAAWLSHWAQQDPATYFALHGSLQSTLEGFGGLKLESFGGTVRNLAAEFSGSEVPLKFGLDQLSEGQRCLICLYTILHFVVAKGGTVVIDEPENFISLREIQPWLMAVSDVVEESGGQVMLISHHPELINQWAPECGVQFVRDGLGPVRVEPFRGDTESSLTPAELIARGWENG